MKSTICYSIVSNFYIDFIPQWGKITDSNDIHSIFICDSHGCFFFFLGVLKLSWKKWLFERSFNCFLQVFFFGLWAVGIVIFNCLQKNGDLKWCLVSLNKLDISVVLGSTGLQTFLTHTHKFLIRVSTS